VKLFVRLDADIDGTALDEPELDPLLGGVLDELLHAAMTRQAGTANASA
jgi:hypothetical protein